MLYAKSFGVKVTIKTKLAEHWSYSTQPREEGINLWDDRCSLSPYFTWLNYHSGPAQLTLLFNSLFFALHPTLNSVSFDSLIWHYSDSSKLKRININNRGNWNNTSKQCHLTPGPGSLCPPVQNLLSLCVFPLPSLSISQVSVWASISLKWLIKALELWSQRRKDVGEELTR